MDSPHYDLYIWASYGVTLILVGGICLVSLIRYMRLRHQFAHKDKT